MPLTNFGSILKFAEDLETQDQAFYSAAADNPACAPHKDLLQQFAADSKKNQKLIQRIRRENVTEMILEPVQGLTRSEFILDVVPASDLDAPTALEQARRLETRAEQYYLKAAEKIKSQAEVARGLKQLAKKHAAHLKQLDVST